MSHALTLAHAAAMASLRGHHVIPEARTFAESLGPMHGSERAILSRWPEGKPYPPLPTAFDEDKAMRGEYDPRWWLPGSRDASATIAGKAPSLPAQPPSPPEPTPTTQDAIEFVDGLLAEADTSPLQPDPEGDSFWS